MILEIRLRHVNYDHHHHHPHCSKLTKSTTKVSSTSSPILHDTPSKPEGQLQISVIGAGQPNSLGSSVTNNGIQISYSNANSIQINYLYYYNLGRDIFYTIIHDYTVNIYSTKILATKSRWFERRMKEARVCARA